MSEISSGSEDRPQALPIEKSPGILVLAGRGFTRRCAWCGNFRAYFRGWFRRDEQCRNCGRDYRRGDDAFELGAITANIMLTFFIILVAIPLLMIFAASSLSVAWIAVLIGALGLLLPIVFYPFSFTVWQAIDLFMHKPSPEELAGEAPDRDR